MGKPKNGGQKGGKQATINLPLADANDSSSDDNNEAAGQEVPDGPAGVVRTMEVLAEPLLELAPERFTKEVVKLEDGDLNHWPQLSVRIENLLMAAKIDSVVHVAVVYNATCVRLPLTPGSLTAVAHATHRLWGSKVVGVVIKMCRADSNMLHRLVTIGCGNGPSTECWSTHDIAKNQRDSKPEERYSAAFCRVTLTSRNRQRQICRSGTRSAKAKTGSARGPWLHWRRRSWRTLCRM